MILYESPWASRIRKVGISLFSSNLNPKDQLLLWVTLLLNQSNSVRVSGVSLDLQQANGKLFMPLTQENSQSFLFSGPEKATCTNSPPRYWHILFELFWNIRRAFIFLFSLTTEKTLLNSSLPLNAHTEKKISFVLNRARKTILPSLCESTLSWLCYKKRTLGIKRDMEMWRETLR